VLEQEAGITDRAVQSAKRSVDVTTAQYKQGTADYLQVIRADHRAADEKSAIDLKTRRMSASVLLIERWVAAGIPPSSPPLRTWREVG